MYKHLETFDLFLFILELKPFSKLKFLLSAYFSLLEKSKDIF